MAMTVWVWVFRGRCMTAGPRHAAQPGLTTLSLRMRAQAAAAATASAGPRAIWSGRPCVFGAARADTLFFSFFHASFFLSFTLLCSSFLWRGPRRHAVLLRRPGTAAGAVRPRRWAMPPPSGERSGMHTPHSTFHVPHSLVPWDADPRRPPRTSHARPDVSLHFAEPLAISDNLWTANRHPNPHAVVGHGAQACQYSTISSLMIHFCLGHSPQACLYVFNLLFAPRALSWLGS
jgi:hypothetical protein